MRLVAFFVVLALMIAAVFGGECSTACTSEYRPVCGRDDAGEVKTFATKCNLDATNCQQKTTYEYVRDGVC
ncbi:Hypothetical predicted protein [Cloeon dipterum]|uniref:Kazal-like domain-containing protein n=1 Tax=Cloeon dipterum TaxID=197152 RepID=A0A8S1DRS9_9INSE|nr:Hypothetical predicted protein [Cloeon dipterum]